MEEYARDPWFVLNYNCFGELKRSGMFCLLTWIFFISRNHTRSLHDNVLYFQYLSGRTWWKSLYQFMRGVSSRCHHSSHSVVYVCRARSRKASYSLPHIFGEQYITQQSGLSRSWTWRRVSHVFRCCTVTAKYRPTLFSLSSGFVNRNDSIILIHVLQFFVLFIVHSMKSLYL